MIKTCCDICGRQLTSSRFKLELITSVFKLKTDNRCSVSVNASILNKINYDLCKECHDKFVKITVTKGAE